MSVVEAQWRLQWRLLWQEESEENHKHVRLTSVSSQVQLCPIEDL